MIMKVESDTIFLLKIVDDSRESLRVLFIRTCMLAGVWGRGLVIGLSKYGRMDRYGAE